MKLARQSGLAPAMDAETRAAATLLAHFGYGAVTGGIYGSLQEGVAKPAVAKGVMFGLAVWTASYLGLLPGLGILRTAAVHPQRRNALMIGAHVVWGASLGFLVDVLSSEAKGRGPEPFSRSGLPHEDA